MYTMEEIQVERKNVMWDASAGLLAVRSFPRHDVQFQSNHLKDPSLFEMRRHMTVMNGWRGQFYGLNVETMLAVERI